MSARPLRVSVIGAGAMGSNHTRVVAGSDRADLVAVVDQDLERAAALAERFDSKAASLDEALETSDAIIVAAATPAHHDLAVAIIAAGVPVLVEKPLASTLDDVRAIVTAAGDAGSVLMCGFVERFNPAVRTAQEYIVTPVRHIVGVRHSPFTPRMTTSVIGDLLIHDIDLAMQIVGDAGVAHAYGAGWIPDGAQVAEQADCTMRFDDRSTATLSASRISHRKIRELKVATEDALVEVDLLRQDVTVYRSVSSELLGASTYRSETVVDIPFVRHSGEPLALQFAHFADLVDGVADRELELRRMLPPHEIASQVVAAVEGPADVTTEPAATR